MIKGLLLTNGIKVILNTNQFFQESSTGKSIELWEKGKENNNPYFIKRFQYRHILVVNEQ